MSPGQARPANADDTRVRRALALMGERLFQGVVGAKPRAVYRRMRLRHAHWMLANTRSSITSIAIDTGFSDGAHFARQFKQMTGVSPSAARHARSTGEACPADPAFARFDGFELACQKTIVTVSGGRHDRNFPWGETANRTLSSKAGEWSGCFIDNQNRRGVRTHAGRSFDDAADFGCALSKGESNAQSSLSTQ